jgi:16S rRNA (guanine527-N7)-methyltransferase
VHAVHPELIETLRLAQRLGFFGAGPIEDAVAHAGSFVDALGELPAEARVIDLGSGGGLPGLVVADAFRAASIVLIDRRQKRTDFLARAVRRLGFEHVDVRCADVARAVEAVARGDEPPFDVVTARGFGPPEATLRTARALLVPTGRIVISEPPVGNRWDPALLDELELVGERHGAVRRFRARS